MRKTAAPHEGASVGMNQGRRSQIPSLERGLLMVLLAGVPLAYSTTAVDPVRLPELTLALLVAAALVGTRVTLAGRGAKVLPADHAALAATAFGLVATLAATIVTLVPWEGLSGGYGRGGGLLLVLASVVTFVVAVDRLDGAAAIRLLRVMLASAVVVAAHGLAQHLGWDPLEWRLPVEAGGATLGNPRVASGLLGAAVPIAVWIAWSTATPRGRTLGGGLALLVLGAAGLAAPHGVIAALVGSTVVVATRLVAAGRPRLAAGGGALVAAAGGVAVAGATGLGPLAGLGGAAARWMGAATWGVVRSEPLTGVGLGRHTAYALEHRPAEAADAQLISEAGPGVPLALLAEGGPLLLAAWLAVVAAVLVALVRGLAGGPSAAPDRYHALAGAGGAWAATTVVLATLPPMPALFLWWWGLGAIVVVLARPTPGRADAAAGDGEVAEVPTVGRGRHRVAVTAGAIATAGLVGLALLPWSADRIAGQGQEYAIGGQPTEAVIALESATDRNPLEARYWRELGELQRSLGDGEGALTALLEAGRRDPRDPVAARESARVAALLDLPDVADEQWRRGVALDPRNTSGLEEAAEHWFDTGRPEEAADLLELALAVDDDPAQRWAEFGRAKLAAGDVEGAEAAFDEAVERDPAVAEQLDSEALP